MLSRRDEIEIGRADEQHDCARHYVYEYLPEVSRVLVLVAQRRHRAGDDEPCPEAGEDGADVQQTDGGLPPGGAAGFDRTGGVHEGSLAKYRNAGSRRWSAKSEMVSDPIYS